MSSQQSQQPAPASPSTSKSPKSPSLGHTPGRSIHERRNKNLALRKRSQSVSNAAPATPLDTKSAPSTSVSSPVEPSLPLTSKDYASLHSASLAGMSSSMASAILSAPLPSQETESPSIQQSPEAPIFSESAEEQEPKESHDAASPSRETLPMPARTPSSPSKPSNAFRTEYLRYPPYQDPKDAPDVPLAPPTGMYWSKALESGVPHPNLRAHTVTLVGCNVYIFGGWDLQTCFNKVYTLDADAFYWWAPPTAGDVPIPLRAMTCTAVGKKIVLFGGGDGPSYYNDIYVLDTLNMRWSRPRLLGDKAPCKRRAHTACLHKNGVYVFGGGDGDRALNDLWRLDVGDSNKMVWKLISSAENMSPGAPDCRPKPRGYHTANMCGGKLIVYGGSDGNECFDDVWIYDTEKHTWKAVDIAQSYRRLSHTATLIGSYIFVVGGHDGNDYCNDLLSLNLVSMTWDKRKTYGKPPAARGYHGTVLYDSRLFVIGGFDGAQVFGDVTILDLAIHAYYSQISHFTIDV